MYLSVLKHKPLHSLDGLAPSILRRPWSASCTFFGPKVTKALHCPISHGHANQSYAAFGNKEQLFRKVLDRYMDGPLSYFGKALAAPKARDLVEQIFLGTARMAEDSRTPAGCLMVQGALACGSASARKEVAARRAAEVALRRRLQRAKREADLPKKADSAELAHYVMTVVRGMAVQSAGGASRDQLHRVAQIALRAWPSAILFVRLMIAGFEISRRN
jgi:AcrR family transcriptional regulator